MFEQTQNFCHLCQKPHCSTDVHTIIPDDFYGELAPKKLKKWSVCATCADCLNGQIDQGFRHLYPIQTQILNFQAQPLPAPVLVDLKQNPNLQAYLKTDEILEAWTFAHHLLFWQKQQAAASPDGAVTKNQASTMHLFFNPHHIDTVSADDIILAAQSVRQTYGHIKKMSVHIHLQAPNNTDLTSKMWQQWQRHLQTQLKLYHAKCVWRNNSDPSSFSHALQAHNHVSLSLQAGAYDSACVRFLSKMALGLLEAYLDSDFAHQPIFDQLRHQIQHYTPDDNIKKYQIHQNTEQEISTLFTSPMRIHIGITHLLGKVMCLFSINHVLLLLDVCSLSDLTEAMQAKLRLVPSEVAHQGFLWCYQAQAKCYQEHDFGEFFAEKLAQVSEYKFRHEIQESLS